jgi:hypothetical protein
MTKLQRENLDLVNLIAHDIIHLSKKERLEYCRKFNEGLTDNDRKFLLDFCKKRGGIYLTIARMVNPDTIKLLKVMKFIDSI